MKKEEYKPIEETTQKEIKVEEDQDQNDVNEIEADNNCKTNATSVRNDLRPEINTSDISYAPMDCETAQCGISSNPSFQQVDYNSPRNESENSVKSVANYLGTKQSTKFLLTVNTHHEASQCDVSSTSSSQHFDQSGYNKTQGALLQCDGGDTDDSSSVSTYKEEESSTTEDDDECEEEDESEEDPPDDQHDQEDPPPWYEPYHQDHDERPAVLRRIVTNERVLVSAELPTIAATNTRSIGPKIRNFTEDILQRQITACLISETWEKEKGSKKFKNEIERIFELSGITFISCPRPSNKRGGGAAIVVDTRKFSCERLNVVVPGNLECVWAIMRPKNVTRDTQFKEIILCAFYSPPKSRKNAKLLDHLISTLHLLLTQYPRCGWVAGGDKNQLPLAPLLGALPKCRQLVTNYTYKGTKIYDVLLTNLGQYYSVPYIAPAVQPDDPSTGAVPSDHDTAVAEPLAGAGRAITREYSVRSSQPFPESGLKEFGAWLNEVKWEGELTWDLNPTQQAYKFEEMCRLSVKSIFPTKSVRVSNEDKPFITAELKKLDKYVKREYRKRGKTGKYDKLKSVYDSKYEKAASQYINGVVEDMMQEAPGKAYRAMKKLGARPGDCDQEAGFTLTSHVDDNLTPKQSVERMADYFSAISQQYSPLDVDLLPERVRAKLEAPINSMDIPKIEAFQVWEIMKAGKKTKSSVPGELPARLRHEFGAELAGPAAIIFNNIASSGFWVEHWKQGAALPLKKVDGPKDESETRLIEITHYLSLQMEKFVLKWLHTYISKELDRDQFGGAKGHSVAHYLIEVMNFILYNQDFSEPLSTILTTVDIHKGFNKVDHSKTITILSDMKVPGWLLRIVASYLSNRSITIRYRQETSSSREMPGGTGAGTVLGLNLFLILFNRAGPAANTISIGQQISKPTKERKPIWKSKVKWVDDVTICTAVDLKSSLVPEDRAVPRPLPYHGRTEQRLPRAANIMQDELDNLRHYTDSHLMAINEKKTKAMMCNTRTKWDFVPELTINQQDNLEIVDQMKIVGYVMRSDMKTSSNTAYLTAKAYKRMWFIRRLKSLGTSTARLLDCLQKQVLSVLWLGAPAWFCQTTENEKKDLNRIAKVGLRIIYGQSYEGFDQMLIKSKMVKPTDQLSKMTQKFATKCANHSKFSQWFEPQPVNQMKTRNKKQKYLQIPARTDRFADSPIPHLTNILNHKSMI